MNRLVKIFPKKMSLCNSSENLGMQSLLLFTLLISLIWKDVSSDREQIPLSSSLIALELYLKQKSAGRSRVQRSSQANVSPMSQYSLLSKCDVQYIDGSAQSLSSELSRKKRSYEDSFQIYDSEHAAKKLSIENPCYMNWNPCNDSPIKSPYSEVEWQAHPIEEESVLPKSMNQSFTQSYQTEINKKFGSIADMVGTHQLALFNYPEDTAHADGSFRYAKHGKGDLSVFQWSLEGMAWKLIGSISADDVSHFVALVKRIQEDSQYKDDRGQKLLQAHIAAMVRQFSINTNASFRTISDALKSGVTRPLSPLSRFTVSYLQRNQIARDDVDIPCQLPLNSVKISTDGFRSRFLEISGVPKSSFQYSGKCESNDSQNTNLASDSRGSFDFHSGNYNTQSPMTSSLWTVEQSYYPDEGLKLDTGFQPMLWNAFVEQNCMNEIQPIADTCIGSRESKEKANLFERRGLRRTVLYDPYRSNQSNRKANEDLFPCDDTQSKREEIIPPCSSDVFQSIVSSTIDDKQGSRFSESKTTESNSDDASAIWRTNAINSMDRCMSNDYFGADFTSVSPKLGSARPNDNRFQRDSARYNEDLEILFASGKARFDCMQSRLSVLLNERHELHDHVAEVGVCLFYPFMESLGAYGLKANQDEYFARFSRPLSCYESSISVQPKFRSANQSLFGDQV